jgi:DtxR family Mn-dependent transcriptional regulator
MNVGKAKKDEHLERLWCMGEQGQDTLATLRRDIGEDFDPAAVAELEAAGLVTRFDDGARVALTPAGEKEARSVVRAHRIGERLIFDAFGSNFESGACEFEHTVTQELVDSICVLLGHPRQCPHGSPIPPGECCRRAERVVESKVVSLTELKVGESGRVVSVNCREDQLLHRMEELHIRPGSVLKVHQKHPSFVLECEGVSIALSAEVAENVSVWASGQSGRPAAGADAAPAAKGWLRRLGR